MYERRLKIFLAMVAAGMVILLARLVHLQILKADEYRQRARDSLLQDEPLPTARGQVLDRNNRVLAADEPCYDLCLHYQMLTQNDPRESQWLRVQLARIRKAHGVDKDQARAIYDDRVRRTWELAEELSGASRAEIAEAARQAIDRIRAWRRRCNVEMLAEELQPHPVVTGLDEATAVRIRMRLKDMIGASIHPSAARRYPAGRSACHLIGRTGPVDESELEEHNDSSGGRSEQQKLTLYMPGDSIGKAGVEKACEDLLRGRRGKRWVQRRTGTVVREIPAEPGRDVHLTLDLDLQREIATELARPGAAVVLDVATGEVLAAVSLPEYDLNTFGKDYPELSKDLVDLPLWNHAVSVRLPPGSTVKPVAALAGLHYGLLDAASTIECRGWMDSPQDTKFRCWIYKRSHGSHGSLDLVRGLEQSCNCFFCTLGQRLGVRRQVEWMTRMGFADPPGTGLPEEYRCILPDPRTEDTVGEARYLAVGQGKLTATPMHVANAMAAIARGGEFRSPLLIREFASRQQVRRLDVTAEQVELVQRGMYRVVNVQGGTAHNYAYDPEIEICGKTGTAQTPARRIDQDGDGVQETIVRSGDTAWFAGYAPYRNPRIAFAVVVEYAQAGGGATCGPIARHIVRLCRQRGYL
ncbi:MAG TPA: penicillin-binding transpeptidase domain-containing protein [Phycisphaerae bacterium]|nr:penicillin-binding transpeptidase domain-containing protein [Phycisphaerae bacterium]